MYMTISMVSIGLTHLAMYFMRSIRTDMQLIGKRENRKIGLFTSATQNFLEMRDVCGSFWVHCPVLVSSSLRKLYIMLRSIPFHFACFWVAAILGSMKNEAGGIRLDLCCSTNLAFWTRSRSQVVSLLQWEDNSEFFICLELPKWEKYL